LAALKLTVLLTKNLIYYEKNFFDCSYAAIQFKRLFSGLPDYGAGMKFNLNEDGSKYLRVISWAQIWGQYNLIVL
jgi:hypothetical protein